jgi:hypothetical protein
LTSTETLNNTNNNINNSTNTLTNVLADLTTGLTARNETNETEAVLQAPRPIIVKRLPKINIKPRLRVLVKEPDTKVAVPVSNEKKIVVIVPKK